MTLLLLTGGSEEPRDLAVPGRELDGHVTSPWIS